MLLKYTTLPRYYNEILMNNVHEYVVARVSKISRYQALCREEIAEYFVKYIQV